MSSGKQEVGDYILRHTLGSGSTGKVKLVEHKESHQLFAMKIIKKSFFDGKPDLQKKIKREIALMRLLDHPHILKLVEVYESQNRLFIVMEYAGHGELYEYLLARRSLPPEIAMHFFRQIIYGLDYLHAHNICHRDLKPENILLNENDKIVIADFGFAKWSASNIVDTSCGSPHYAAPEIIKGHNYDGRKSDIWSCGVILYALLAGKLPFDEPSARALLSKIKSGSYRMPSFPAEIQDLISKILVVDPAKRINLEKIKHHPAFRMGIPRGYVFPGPLPMPESQSPIDPTQIEKSILDVFRQIGYDSDEELFSELHSDEPTSAKVFYLMLTRNIKIDDLPWPIPDPQEPPKVDFASDQTIQPPRQPIGFEFQAPNSPFQQRKGSLGSDSLSVYSFAERVSWAYDLQTDVPVLRTYDILDILCQLESLFVIIQGSFNSLGYDWFYPSDTEMFSRRQSDMVDIHVQCAINSSGALNLHMHLLQGSVAAFDDSASQSKTCTNYRNPIKSCVC